MSALLAGTLGLEHKEGCQGAQPTVYRKRMGHLAVHLMVGCNSCKAEAFVCWSDPEDQDKTPEEELAWFLECDDALGRGGEH